MVFKTIMNGFSSISLLIEQIAKAIEQQNIALEGIVRAVINIKSSSEENTAKVIGISEKSKNINDIAEESKKNINRFKL